MRGYPQEAAFKALIRLNAAPGESNWALGWIMRIDIDAVLRDRFAHLAGRLQPPAAGDLFAGAARLVRAACALVLAREAAGRAPGTFEEVAALAEESIADELADCLAGITASTEGLPTMALVAPADEVARAPETDPVRVIAVLARVSGRTFDRSAGPMLSEALLNGAVIDLWAAE